MEWFVPLVAFLAAALSFLSGFGLGTVLMPAMALVVPLEVAIALTAVVHLLNNLLKLRLMWRFTQWDVVRQFGLPALAAAAIGALSLVWLQHYERPLRWVIAGLILFFVVWEYWPQPRRTVEPHPRWMIVGGILSGFFGGISGHQGTFRSAFLLQWRLSKEQFIATGVAIACVIDLMRLTIYGQGFLWHDLRTHASLLICTTAAAVLGTFVGRRLLPHISLRAIHHLVAVLMCGIAMALVLGWV